MFVHIGILFVLLQSSYCVERYDGHKVLEILHKAESDFIKILEMELKYKLDFWKLPKHVDDSMKVRVSPEHLEDFLHELEAINADVSTMIENVQDIMDEHQVQSEVPVLHRRASSYSSGWSLNVYYSYSSILNYLTAIAAATLPNNMTATLETLGTSYEGRVVRMIKLSKAGSAANKRKIFIDGGIHAREWVSPATVIYMIEMLAYNPNNNASINTLLNRYDVYLAPLINPDGYQYSGSSYRLWRKNRRNNPQGNCYGVDLNRNFPFQWDPIIGGSNSPCSDLFSGATPGSEPETANIVNYLMANGDLFDAYLTIHSYGQMWLYPWGYTSALPSDHSDLHNAALSGKNAIAAYQGMSYLVGSSTNELYAAAGGSDDFAKGGAGIKYSYTIELRDQGDYGFQLPATLIIPTAKEFFDGFVAFADTMYTHLYGSSGK
ncbi:Sodium-dependent noradrenaline transporter [Mactra antiquata]